MRNRWASFLILFLTVMLVGACSEGGSHDESTNLPETECDEAMILHLGFDEENGNKAIDQSGETGDGAIQYVFTDAKYNKDQDPVRNTGVKGTSLWFDGYSTAVEVPSLSLGNVFSISVWLAPYTFEDIYENPYTVILDQTSADRDSGFSLGYGDYGQVELRFTLGFSENHKPVHYNMPIEDCYLSLHEWQQLVVTFDFPNGSVNIYLNGVLLSEHSLPDGSHLKEADVPLLIGRSYHPVLYYDDWFESSRYTGVMDELMVWKKALSEEEVKTLYRNYLDDNGNAPTLHYTDIVPSSDLLANDWFHPQYHAASNLFMMGETISPFYYNGKYHLFYQQHPLGIRCASWGHFVSDDMVHWTEVLPALYPEKDTLDCRMSFSGNAILDAAGNPYIFYTGQTKTKQVLMGAVPTDLTDPLLLYWDKINKEIVTPQDGTSSVNFRDPFLYAEDGYVYMLVGASDTANVNPRIVTYKAKQSDLTDWTYLGVTHSAVLAEHPELSSQWELPVLFRLESDNGIVKYLLGLNPIPSKHSTAYFYYWLGDFDTETGRFTPDFEDPRRIDYTNVFSIVGGGFVDPVSGENIFFSSLALDFVDPAKKYQAGWHYSTSLMKALSLDNEGNLVVSALSNYEAAHQKNLLSLSKVTAEEASKALKGVEGTMLHIRLNVDMKDANSFTLIFRKSASERTLVTYNASSQTIGLDFSESSMMNIAPWDYSMSQSLVLKNNILTLDLYLDKAVVELFLDADFTMGGAAYSLPTSDKLDVRSDGEVEILSFDIWDMTVAES